MSSAWSLGTVPGAIPHPHYVATNLKLSAPTGGNLLHPSTSILTDWIRTGKLQLLHLGVGLYKCILVHLCTSVLLYYYMCTARSGEVWETNRERE